ncbi:MAG: CopG family transcriptional regulator [Proteobacteria bacterium SG_bin4]|nr:MAG: CopG family transcriptional regulator [Proteobacteria bacterium SG_bin4]
MNKQIKTLLVGSLMTAGLLSVASQAAATTTVEVYKSPTCGCCAKWVDHMRDHGFTVKTHDVGNKEIRKKSGLSESVGSCHTALVNGYAIEGHVPAPDIIRLLKEKPKAIGLSVPDMPHGTPGMEGARSDPYNVLLITERDQSRKDATIYNRYDPYAKKAMQSEPVKPEAEKGGSVMRIK